MLAENLARLLRLAVGEQTLELHFSGGRLRRGDLHVGPLKPEELRMLELRVERYRDIYLGREQEAETDARDERGE